jgi:hypothetical protein
MLNSDQKWKTKQIIIQKSLNRTRYLFIIIGLVAIVITIAGIAAFVGHRYKTKN